MQLKDATVLIVDDEPDLLDIMADWFRREAHCVLIAANGKEALDAIEANQVDVVVSDVRMPVMDGPGLHEALGEVYDAAAAGKLDVERRMRLRLATTYGMNEATDVSIACYRAAGTAAISEKAPFERRFRDAMSASQHLQGMLPHVEMVGRHIIGTENVVQFV